MKLIDLAYDELALLPMDEIAKIDGFYCSYDDFSRDFGHTCLVGKFFHSWTFREFNIWPDVMVPAGRLYPHYTTAAYTRPGHEKFAACAHEFPDTGMRKSWCKHCECVGNFDPVTARFVAAE